ncbi:hypothetical protein KRP22_012915 [Phytophthora ramorum]|nr:hypothetical protein KRP22_8657 [Phytophthora ramorum]
MYRSQVDREVEWLRPMTGSRVICCSSGGRCRMRSLVLGMHSSVGLQDALALAAEYQALWCLVKSANVIDYPIHLDGAHRPKENPAVLVRNSLASSGPLTSSLLDAERQGIVHKHAGHLLRTKLSDDVVSAVAV